MRTFQLPNLIGRGLMVGSLALTATAPIAAEPASSVNFANRDALTATSVNGWRNPLRADSGVASGGGSQSSNSLRQNVKPVSYDQQMNDDSFDGADEYSRAPSGLKLRPHTQQTGIFSSLVGEGAKTFAKPFAKPRPATKSARQPQFHQVPAKPAPPLSAAREAVGMMPQFKSSRARKQSDVATATGQPPMMARAGSAMQNTAQTPTQRTTAHSGGAPASYNTAASAQAYRHNTMPPSAPSTARRPHTLHTAPLSRPTSNPPRAEAGSPVAILNDAHQLAGTARTEADYSKIFAMCKQIPARTATAEEAAFGRQLAAWALNRRGQLRAREGKINAAMADFDRAVRIDAKCWRALHNRGVLLARAGRFEPAFDDFHHTIELNPSFAKAYANRGALYVRAGELEPALADYQHAAKLDPKFATAQRGWGRTCHMLGRLVEAREHLTRAIELAPRDAMAYAGRGDLLTDLGQYEAAADDYEQALAINPKYVDAYRGSAWLLATCPDGTVRNPGVALERAQQAAELERKADATTFDTLAAAQASVGDFKTATQTICHAIEIAPPAERSVYQDRMQMYRQSQPYRIEPLSSVRQAGYTR